MVRNGRAVQSGGDTPAVVARGLTKRYGDVEALRGVDLEVPRGRIFALLGPNGAGKTTFLSILTTLLRPTSGTARVLGIDVATRPDEVRRRIGVTFQEIVLDPELTGREVLYYHGRLYGLRGAELRRRIDELVQLVALQEAAGRPTRTYSGGMKRRLELARGLLTHPEVLILDEPTQGLDPQNRAYLWDHLRELPRRFGTTVLLSTHYMEEAERLADRVAIIDHGRVVAEGTPAGLVEGLGADLVTATGRGDLHQLAERLRAEDFVQDVQVTDGQVQIGVDHGGRRLPRIAALAAEAGCSLEELAVHRPSLGDVFLRVTGRRLRDE
ncbi:ATP-binding cassette domain-containing protein [Caldinitratiruptor microaerophilus]|uniref:Daunorubicin ABC transporter ATP-binding protein n=1 Tax=Caldinitratiruptor microaerophilus TaxID=671077 RepID=A0AA35G8W2_9FIRM|nr:ATP-binding cassette domain-containing protein [Caldinitratiruptor microaerophilus]BDG59659.1 daunorubicin ABC transporter ATP-binding protein [Caldinitratiruptor microaerophilus]